MDFVAQYVYVCCLIVGSMASPHVIDFFPEIKGNLSLVTWAHAVNNRTFLNKTLKNNGIMMIEADVSIGTAGEEQNTTIMAHPPNNTSDITLRYFLQVVNGFNRDLDNKIGNGTKKGIKLDFKSTLALEKAVDDLKNYTSTGRFPIWINADIIPGPINSNVLPVEAAKFFQLTRDMNNTVLSIGWTTNYGPNMNGSYDKSQIDAMLTTINTNNVTKEITFPVRAGLAAESLSEMRRIIETVKNSTLTLWSSENDKVNITKLNNLLVHIGAKKLYIDVPESLRKQLSFNSSIPNNSTGTTSTASPSTNTTTPTATPHNYTTKAPNKNSGTMLRFGSLSMLFVVIICLL